MSILTIRYVLLIKYLYIFQQCQFAYPKFENCLVFTKNMNDELGFRFIRKILGIKNTEDFTNLSGTLELTFITQRK